MCKRLPSKIEACPIIDALIEIRFEPMVARSAVFGLIYNQIMDTYPGNVISLPILQISEQIRDTDPNLKFKPLYGIEGKNTVVQIGPDVFCISSRIPYIGWNDFSSQSVSIIRKITDANIIKKVLRLGHRYVNFFEGDIINNLTVNVSMLNDYKIENLLIRSEVKDEKFTNIIQISNSAQYKPNSLAKELLGTMIDIDASCEYTNDLFLTQAAEELNAVHLCEKKLFFSLLKPEFLNSLNPTYHE